MMMRRVYSLAAMLAVAALASQAAPILAADGPIRDNVRLVERRQGDVISIWAQLIDCTEATVTVDLSMTNMEATGRSPITIDVDAPATEIVRLAPINPRFQHQYRYNFNYRVGKRPRGGTPDAAKMKRAVYMLPYDRDASFEVSQGRIGRTSHFKGSDDENAIDWLMPIGTKVRAAHPGTVVGIRKDTTVSGLDPSFKPLANHVLIKHDDGTLGDYLHLKPDGVAVRLGQKIREGDLLGYSGNTGYTDRPHLHFVVFYNIDGKTRRNVPVLFRTKDGRDDPLEEGKTY
jgi:murein DD-endopeptidase MepM/ murein hydrolase activator NlpD